MIIAHNLSALNSLNRLNQNNKATSNTLEKLSSGYQINKAADDAAESRIRDADMARETMKMAKSQILTQASQTMLAHANQQPESVMNLLQ